MKPISGRKFATMLLVGLAIWCRPSGLSAENRGTRSATAVAQATDGEAAGWKDRSQWRKLQRGMSEDDVRRLLGEPGKVSVARSYEFWYYAGGDVAFDKKGRVDSWDEP